MRLTGAAQVVGVFGDPVRHSLSPAMHQAAFAHLALDWVYVPFHVRETDLSQAVTAVRALGLAGVNITVPHKVAVMDWLDVIDPEARAIGAVNTIVNRDGHLTGYNTDGRGFLRSLTEETGTDPAGKNFLLLGAGGAALAIAYAAVAAGARAVWIANRTEERAVAIVQSVRAADSGCILDAVPLDARDGVLQQAAADADIIVQCTSVGMFPDHERPPILSPTLFRSDALAVDIVYTPRETAFIQEARAHGCRVLTGEGMLAYQGAISFELWTGRPAPADVMIAVLRSHLEEADG